MSNQLQITGGAKVRNLQGVITGTSGVLGSLGINVPDGIPQLDGSGKILVSQLPNSVMEYKGTWNVATNTPYLVDGVGNAGDVYIVTGAATGGTLHNFGAGNILFYNGDQAIYDGSLWQRASGSTGSVTSVAMTTPTGLSVTGSPITTSGTLAVSLSSGYIIPTTSFLNGLVPYTGATSDVDLGTFKLNAQSVGIKGTGGAGHLGLKHQSSAATASASESSLYANNNGDLAWKNDNLYTNTFITHGITADRAYTFPNTSGTLALTSDLSAYVPYTGATNHVNLGIYNLTADVLIGNQIKAATSSGININSSSGTQVALFGAGGGAGTTFYGGINGTSASLNGSGSTETLAINHSSGTGIALNITKAGNGEALYINKTSGTGNAATIIGNVSITGTGSFGSTLTANGVIVSGQLTLYSTITNGSYTYTLPSATGTLALTSQIPSITGTAYQVARFNSAGNNIEGGSIFDTGTSGGSPVGQVTINSRLTTNNYAEVNRYLSIIQNVDSSWALPSTGTSIEAFITSASGGLLVTDTAYLRPRKASDDTFKRFIIQGDDLILNDTTRRTLINKAGPTQTTTKLEVAGYTRFDSNVNLNGSLFFKATDASQPTYISESSGNLTALTSGQITLGTNSTSKFVFDVNGALNLGTSDNSNIININNQFTTLNPTMQGVHITPSIVSASPVIYTGVRSYPQFFLSGVGNFAEIKHFAALNASNTQNNASQIGLYIENLSSNGLAYGIQSLINSGTSRYNLYISGTANNYFKGRIGVDQTNPQYAIDVTGDVNVTGNFKVNGTNLTQGVSGGGTQHYIPKYTSATSVGNSAIYQAPASGHVLVNTLTDYSSSGGYLQVGGGFTTESFANIIYGSALYAGNSVYLKLVNGNTIQSTGDRTYFIENRVNSGATSANYYLNYWDGGTTQTRYTLDNTGLHTFSGAVTISGTLTGAGATFSTNVGIGLTNPQRLLEVYSTTADNHLRLSGSGPSVSMGEAITGSVYQAKFGLATASNQFVSGSVAGDFVISNQTGSTIWAYNSVEKMRLNTNGRLLIGTSTDNGSLLQVAGAATFSSSVTANNLTIGPSTTFSTLNFNYNGTNNKGGLAINYNTGEYQIWAGESSNGYFQTFYTNGSERMRITSGGNLLVGTTTDVGQKFVVNGGVATIDNYLTMRSTVNSTNYGLINEGNGLIKFAIIGVQNSAQITMSSGAYTALSDSTKKKDFELSTLGLNEVMKLKPTLYRFKTENNNVPKSLGFIAQEVKQVIPQAYVENGEGENKFIGLNFNPIVATLTKAIQEQQAQIEELKQLINK